ncbi:MAG: DUF2336 domain-containing protein [Pseudomonadota bacterium]
MLSTFKNRDEILSTLKSATAKEASSEQLFDLVFELFVASSDTASKEQRDMCEDVLTQLISYVELEARRRISDKLAILDAAPRRIIQCLAIENIYVAQPVLTHSPVLQDEDLLMVARLCGPQHLEAIAERKTVSCGVTNELMRLGNVHVWERLAGNSGAALTDKSIAFLVNRARENTKIQLGLIDRPDLSENSLKQLVSEAGESVRQYLADKGRQDLLVHLDQAKAAAYKRVLSTSSVLGFEYETAYRSILQLEEKRALNHQDLLTAAGIDDFPTVCCVFARLTNLNLEEAVHWLSRREVDPAMVALKAIDVRRDIVEAVLRTGPWRRILTPQARNRALRTFDQLEKDVAMRIFKSRNTNLSHQAGAA